MTPALDQFKARAADFWQQRDARERKILLGAGAFLVAVLVWLLAIEPAVNGIASMHKTLPTLRAQAAELAGLAGQAGQATRTDAMGAVAPVSRETVDAALARQQLKAQNVVVSGELVRLTLNNASFAALVSLQDELQRAQRLVVVDAAIEPLEAADMVNATVTLRQQLPGAQ